MWPFRTTSQVQREQGKLQAERLRLAQRQLREEARRAHELANLQHRAEVENLTDVRKAQKQRRTWTFSAEKWKKRLKTWRTVNRGVVLAGANVAVNVGAITGQFLGLLLGAEWDWWWALVAAAITESVAVNVGFYAHDRLIKGYNAIVTRSCSYLIGLGVAINSYSHNHTDDVMKDAAAMFAGMSLLSPILWHLYGVWKHSDNQYVKGTHKQPAPSFSWQRWIIPSLRPETKAAYIVGVAEDISDPTLCIEIVRSRRSVANTYRALTTAYSAVVQAQRAQLQLALAHSAALTQESYGNELKRTESPPKAIPGPSAEQNRLDSSSEQPRHAAEPADNGRSSAFHTASDAPGVPGFRVNGEATTALPSTVNGHHTSNGTKAHPSSGPSTSLARNDATPAPTPSTADEHDDGTGLGESRARRSRRQRRRPYLKAIPPEVASAVRSAILGAEAEQVDYDHEFELAAESTAKDRRVQMMRVALLATDLDIARAQEWLAARDFTDRNRTIYRVRQGVLEEYEQRSGRTFDELMAATQTRVKDQEASA